MRRIKVGVAALRTTPLGWEANAAAIGAALEEARRRGVRVLCLPELSLTGYGCDDMFLAPFVAREAWARLEALAPRTAGMVVNVGLPVAHRGAVFNASALLADGEIVGIAAKQHLPGDGVHYEPRWFRPWPQGEATELDRGGRRIPFGDLSFEVGDLTFGFEICEDAWVAERPGARLAKAGVDVILNPSASHFAFGKHDVRLRLVREGGRAFGCVYLYANLLGNEAGRVIYDGDGMIAEGARLRAETERFRYAAFSLADAVVDIDAVRLLRASRTSFTPEPSPARVARAAFHVPGEAPDAGGAVAPRSLGKEEAFARCVALGLFDYLVKSRGQGYVVSLSGGADSAACAYLVRLMVELGLAELGRAGFRAALGHVPLPDTDDLASLTAALLTTAYQATRNSSAVTRDAARAVAEDVGSTHHEIEVDAMVQAYTQAAEVALGRTLEWDTDDLALQNVQARSRAPSIWLLANVRRQILLATSNRSEAAVGYTTMDGDTAGGLSPIAGIDKAFLRHWLRWLETEGSAAIAPRPALAAVNAQQPTAELRPADASADGAQTDEKDLMPYPVLDAIERLAIRDKKAPREVHASLGAFFPEASAALRLAWTQRFFQLWVRNQWKRERYAPSFHLDDENLDPKTWCRFPILSDAYRHELDALAAELAAEGTP
ncbi:MAG: NAD(+) synthase [Myxococcota bacterium]